MSYLLCADQVSFYVVTKCLSVCSEEEVVEVSSTKVVEIPPPLVLEEDWKMTSCQGVSKLFITVNFIIQKRVAYC